MLKKTLTAENVSVKIVENLRPPSQGALFEREKSVEENFVKTKAKNEN